MYLEFREGETFQLLDKISGPLLCYDKFSCRTKVRGPNLHFCTSDEINNLEDQSCKAKAKFYFDN